MASIFAPYSRSSCAVSAESAFTSSGEHSLITPPASLIATRPSRSARSQPAPARRANFSPEIFMIASWSAFEIDSNFFLFIANQNEELYRPPFT